MPEDQLLRNLRMNALLAHQHSVGRGDELVQILKHTIEQMEKTHVRVQTMSSILFGAGLLLLAVGVYLVLSGDKGGWGALLGGTGGVASLISTFWTAPVDKMSKSISDLVKLEAAFLGYIRVIGELDSAFQMQYLGILSKTSGTQLDQVTSETTKQMKDVMTHTVTLIDQYVTGSGATVSELQKQGRDLEARMKKLEAARP